MGVRLHFIALAVISVAALACQTGATEEKSAVIEATNSSLDQILTDNELVLVKFYAPWCGHCKSMAPHYDAASIKLKEMGSKVVLAKVDATVESELADTHDIKGYPTLKFFRNKVASDYAGGRTTEKIVEWITAMSGPALIEYDETKEDDSKVAFYGDFKSKSVPEHKLYEGVAEIHRQEAKFFVSYKESNTNRIYVKRKGEGVVDFDEKAGSLVDFVKNEWFPLFGPIDADNFKNYADRELDLAWFCGSPSDYEKISSTIREVSKNYKNTYSFVWLDTDQFKSHAEGALGITEFPGLVLQTKKGRYPFPSAILSENAGTIDQFLKDIIAGKIEKSLKSEPIPETNDEAVKVVVSKQFEEMVFQKDKDVFLEVYAPWCGHCKSFEPIYKEFAEKMKDAKHLLVTKMDGTANESPDENFDWTGFPTIFFLKAGEKTPIKYSSGRNIKDLVAFTKENSSKPINVEVEDNDEL